MIVGFSPEALEQLGVRRTWWVNNRRDAAQRFDEEVQAAVVVLSERGDTFPVIRRIGDRAIRRWLMAKVRCHLYFEVSDREIVIVSAWGAQMGRTPPIR